MAFVVSSPCGVSWVLDSLLLILAFFTLFKKLHLSCFLSLSPTYHKALFMTENNLEKGATTSKTITSSQIVLSLKCSAL